MTNDKIIKAFDILNKFEFFGGQRAGRELWFNKPSDVQNKDIGSFLRDINFLRQFINDQQMDIKRLEDDVKSQDDSITSLLSIVNSNYQNGRIDATKEFVERLKAKAVQKYDWNEYVEIEDIDNLAEEMLRKANYEL